VVEVAGATDPSLRSDLADPAAGASLVGYLPAGTGVVATTVQSKLRESVSVLDFYANGVSGPKVDPTGVIDSTLGIQAAIDSLGTTIASTSGGTVLFPHGVYKTTSALNLTNRDSVHLLGANGAQIVSTSADYIADCTSLAYSLFENLQFVSSTAIVGLYYNRSTTRPSAELNKIKNCFVSVATNTAANNARGSIGIYNCRAELFECDGVWIDADCPLYAEKLPTTSYLLPVYTTIQPTGAYDSMTINTYADCIFSTIGNYASAVFLDDCLGFEFSNSYWKLGAVVNGSNTYAVITRNLYRSKFSGSCEVFPQFLHSLRVASDLIVDIAVQGDKLNTSGVLNGESISTDVGGFQNCDIKVLVAGTPTVGASVVAATRAYNYTWVKGNKIECSSATMSLLSVGATSRLNDAVQNNIEIAPARMLINNIREYYTFGGYVANDVSFEYTVPSSCVYVEITAKYITALFNTENEVVRVYFARHNGGNGRISSDKIAVGTANKLNVTFTPDVITFTQASNGAAEHVGYMIKEVYGPNI
jgi:hypothetical protein